MLRLRKMKSSLMSRGNEATVSTKRSSTVTLRMSVKRYLWTQRNPPSEMILNISKNVFVKL